MVRCDVAAKRKLSENLFWSLAEDADESVRATVAVNKKAPDAVLHQLSGDECVIVSERARQQLERRQANRQPL